MSSDPASRMPNRIAAHVLKLAVPHGCSLPHTCYRKPRSDAVGIGVVMDRPGRRFFCSDTQHTAALICTNTAPRQHKTASGGRV